MRSTLEWKSVELMRSLDGGETWTGLQRPSVELAGRPHLKSKSAAILRLRGMMDTHALTMSAAQPGTVFLAVVWACSAAPTMA